MDKLEKYRATIKQLLSKQAEYEPANIDLETILVLDDNSANYQIMYVGWHNSVRTHGALIHVRLKDDGKIWIEYDGTEEGFASHLLEAGISKEDIVLAFHSPWKRKFTDFAVA